jgi:hypothetical protein
MTTESLQLLKRLEPAVRPGVSLPAHGAKPQAALEAQSFDQLLAMAASGKIQSGRQIQLSFEPTKPLEPAQLERLADAADQAEGAGMNRALMVIDGRAFVLDVKSRMLTAEVSTGSAGLVQNIDGAIFVGGSEGAPHQISWPSGVVVPQPNLKHLSNTPTQKV